MAATFAPLVAGRLVAVSAPVIFELGFSARSPGDYREVMDGLAAFPTVPTGDADHRRALEVQSRLASRSRHRALSLVDALVAAVAEARRADRVALRLRLRDCFEHDRPGAPVDRRSGIGRLNRTPRLEPLRAVGCCDQIPRFGPEGVGGCGRVGGVLGLLVEGRSRWRS